MSASVAMWADMAAALARNSVVFDDQVGTHWVRWHIVEAAPAEAGALSVAR